MACCNRVGRGCGGGVMLWAVTRCRTNEHRGFLLKALNARRNCDEIVGPIAMPFILHHHFLLQHNNAWPHVAMICAQFLDAEIIPVLTWPAYSPGMSPTWSCLGSFGSTGITVGSNFCQHLATWCVDQCSAGHNQYSDQLYAKEIRQSVVIPDTEWFSAILSVRVRKTEVIS